MLQMLVKEGSFSETFQSGVQIRDKRDATIDSTSKEQVREEDFSEQSFDDFWIDPERVLGS
jgi:hypothetical protein